MMYFVRVVRNKKLRGKSESAGTSLNTKSWSIAS